ncbi:MAG: hypothetical protein GKR96_11985 [Gammaproteobacteria bacterium]|nr:hypothetical protein [Gammaproteobacteria bacterium]
MIQLDKNENVAILRLDNGVTNPISLSLLHELENAVIQIKAGIGSQYRGLLLAGGEKFFSIGFDLPSLVNLNQDEFKQFWGMFNQIFFDLYTLPVPTICAMKGHAIAGGAVLALGADFRIGAEEKKRIGLNEIKLGIPIPFSADLVLRQIVTDRVATNIIYSGDFFTMDSMCSSGLIDQVHPAEDVEDKALETLTPLTLNCGPAFNVVKENRTASIKHTYDTFCDEKDQQFMAMWFSPEVQERLLEAAKTF